MPEPTPPLRGAPGPGDQAPGRPKPSGARPAPLGGAEPGRASVPADARPPGEGQPACKPAGSSAHQPLRGAPPVWPYLAIAAVVVALDQWSKLAIEGRFAFGERLNLIPGWFDLTLAYNTGAAFSFLAGAGGWQRWLFSGIAVAASLFIVWLLFRSRGERSLSIALAFILGGAIGNLIDRIAAGKVTDFLLFYRADWYFPAFNLADAALTFGAILMIGDELLRLRRPRPAAR